MTPARGDVYLVGLDPAEGREQKGTRRVLVVTTATFNKIGHVMCCPITTGGNFARLEGFTVSLTGAGTDTQGVVLCHQLRSLDLKARRSKRIEALPGFIVEDVLAKLHAILD